MAEKRIFIVEDDPIIASDLEGTLIELGYIVCGIAHQPFDAKKRIEKLVPDLILLDINLNSDIDGIDLATLIKNNGVDVIFISAFNDKSTFDRVKQLSPLGYIIKPYTEKDIEITLDLAFINQANKLDGTLKKRSDETHFFVKSKNNVSIKINFTDILYIEACDNYSFIHTIKEKIMVSFTLKELEHKIHSTHLVRVHRSFIINKQKVDALQYNNLIIGSIEIPIGKSYKEDIANLFQTL